MKTKKIKFLVIACCLAFILGCEKDIPSGNEDMKAEVLKTNELLKDSSITSVPDINVDDSILQDNAQVSQYSEDYLTYSYDRAGRLSIINYIKRNIPQPSTSADLASRFVYMQDRFEYGNAGRLIEIVRFNLTFNSSATRIITTRSYKYNKSGQLAVIITRSPDRPAAWEKKEFLYYDNLGNMVEKIINEPYAGTYKLIYSYDKESRLIKITGFRDESIRLQFICDLFYDNLNNIEHKEFYYGYPWAASVNDVLRKWVVRYKYDNSYNPFRDFKLPVSSLFEWMDVISPSNITAISLNNSPADKVVYYKYRYNAMNYPLLRYRINLLPFSE